MRLTDERWNRNNDSGNNQHHFPAVYSSQERTKGHLKILTPLEIKFLAYNVVSRLPYLWACIEESLRVRSAGDCLILVTLLWKRLIEFSDYRWCVISLGRI
jgi:hypothetical protein